MSFKGLTLWPATNANMAVGLLAAILAFCPLNAALAQGSRLTSVATDSLTKANPDLAKVAQIAPDMLTVLLLKLAPLLDRRESLPPDRPRPPSAPTAAQEVQFARNPALAAAYRRDPDEALRILDLINTLLKQSRS